MVVSLKMLQTILILIGVSQVRSITLLDCKCGTSSSAVSYRIFGAVEAKENQYPWVVYIEFNKDKYCGGVLINNLFVLTSGHCVDKKLNFKILVNTRDPKRLYPAGIVKHPDYKMDSSKNIINDIALVKLSHEVDFNGNLYPICLPHPESDYTRKIGKILGWGLMNENTKSNVLREAEVQVMSNNYCKNSMIGKYYHPSQICAFSNLSDACQGDSGGPLFFENSDGQHELVGLISWGIKCGTQMPGVYTRVTSFMEWIEDNTADAGYCNI